MEESIIQKSSEERGHREEDVMQLDEFLDFAEDNPISIADSVNYLLCAIEHYGTREVIENGEEIERYRFFDDPYCNGENAILGNTRELNEFVDEVRRRASEEGDNNKIIWFVGPTASGKSELKRCIINGIRAYSETDEGARYTLEWTLDDSSSNSRMSYGEKASIEKRYYKSPINVNPLTILPPKTRENYMNYVRSDFELDCKLGPFSKEVLESLEEDMDFQEIVSEGFVRVKRVYPEVGDGIGVLHSEDNGNPKQKIVGSWMEGAMQKFAKRGHMNPQAFSYDGVLSQGNGLVSIVEDGAHHFDVLAKMLNVCEEEMVKLNNKISMDLDTLIMIFSNRDLEERLREYSSSGQSDPMRAVRRRLDKYEFGYLTTVGIEGMLIKRILFDENYLWEDEDRMEKVSEEERIYDTEIAPRTIEAAAMYEVSTRVDCSGEDSIALIEYLETGEDFPVGKMINTSESIIHSSIIDGDSGIPVTYTVDKIVEKVQENDFVLPTHVTRAMRDGFEDEPMFDGKELEEFNGACAYTENYIYSKQQEDVLQAMVGDITVTEEDVRNYIDSILAWDDDRDDEYDAYELREFETRYLGQDISNYGKKAKAEKEIVEFREGILSPINKYMWDKREEDFTIDDVPLSECPPLKTLLDENDWDMVERVFPDADLRLWESPPSDTEVNKLKQKTIKRMKEQGYSQESAEEVSNKVVPTGQMDMFESEEDK